MEKYQFREGQRDHLKADNIYYKLHISHIFQQGISTYATWWWWWGPGARVPDINRSHVTCPGFRLGIIFWLWTTQIRWQLLKTIPRICIYQSFHPPHCSAHMERWRQWVTRTSRNLCWRQLTVPELLSYLLSIIYYLQTFLNVDVDTMKYKQSSEKEPIVPSSCWQHQLEPLYIGLFNWFFKASPNIVYSSNIDINFGSLMP